MLWVLDSCSQNSLLSLLAITKFYLTLFLKIVNNNKSSFNHVQTIRKSSRVPFTTEALVLP
jgi:hypothetical protein